MSSQSDGGPGRRRCSTSKTHESSSLARRRRPMASPRRGNRDNSLDAFTVRHLLGIHRPDRRGARGIRGQLPEPRLSDGRSGGATAAPRNHHAPGSTAWWTRQGYRASGCTTYGTPTRRWLRMPATTSRRLSERIGHADMTVTVRSTRTSRGVRIDGRWRKRWATLIDARTTGLSKTAESEALGTDLGTDRELGRSQRADEAVSSRHRQLDVRITGRGQTRRSDPT